MPKIYPAAKKRYSQKTRRIAFSLNIKQTEQAAELTQKEANALAKGLFLEEIKGKGGNADGETDKPE